MIPAVRECLAVLVARGVDPAAWPDAAPYLTQPAAALATAARQSTETAWVQRTFTAGHFRKNAEEMTRFYLDVLETGERLGVDMPTLRGFEARITGPTTSPAPRLRARFASARARTGHALGVRKKEARRRMRSPSADAHSGNRRRR